MKEVLEIPEKQMKILGWVATFMSVMMYVSYFPQIMNNLAGQKKKEIFRLPLPMHRELFLAW